jgi:hypothetical protein
MVIRTVPRLKKKCRVFIAIKLSNGTIKSYPNSGENMGKKNPPVITTGDHGGLQNLNR